MAPFKSSKGRDAGKKLEIFRSTSIGQGIGGGGGGDAGPTPITASGGTKTTFPSWVIHEFTGSGTFSIDSGTGFINLLLVAGGTSGAPNRGGGGGAGGALHRCNIPVTPSSSYPVSIGAGGSPVGSNSTFGPTFTAYGGASARGSNTSPIGSVNIRTIPAPLSPQGQGGGGGDDPSAGGGGGAGTPGFPTSEPHPVQNTAAGGRGIILDAIPTAYGDNGYFAGGGGGGGGPFSPGGLGGGGDSPSSPYGNGGAGTANTGGGGGGGADGGGGGTGGSGVCIVYYEAP